MGDSRVWPISGSMDLPVRYWEIIKTPLRPTTLKQALHTIKKGLQPDRLSQVIAMVQAAGIEVELFTLFGLPGETKAHISQQLHLFFGTPIADDPARHGIIPTP